MLEILEVKLEANNLADRPGSAAIFTTCPGAMRPRGQGNHDAAAKLYVVVPKDFNNGWRRKDIYSVRIKIVKCKK